MGMAQIAKKSFLPSDNHQFQLLPRIKRRRRFDDKIKLGAVQYCIEDCKGNKMEATRNRLGEWIRLRGPQDEVSSAKPWKASWNCHLIEISHY